MKRKLLTCLLVAVVALSLFGLIACDIDNTDDPITKTYSVTITQCENGTVQADKQTVDEGGSVTFTVAASDGYELTSFTVNGSEAELTDGKYTLENVSADVTAAATFQKIVVKHTVTFNYGSGNGVEATRTVDEGTSIGELPAVMPPFNGASLGWYVDGTAIDATYVVNADVTVKARILTVELDVSGSSAIIGLAGEADVVPEITFAVKVDGESSDIAVTLCTSDDAVATITDGKLSVVADGTVSVIAKYNDNEIARIDDIACRNYADYTAIATKSDFAAIADNRAGKYYLTADIDWGNSGIWTSDWQPLLGTFTGVLDGRGHSISNGTHNDGWNNGIASDVQGVIRDIAFINMRVGGSRGSSANNAFFGKVTGLVENVYLDYLMPYTQSYDSEAGAAALASYLDKGGLIRNVVVNLNCSGNAYIDRVGAIAVSANSSSGYAQNVLVMTNGKPVTGSVLEGLYAKEAEAGVAQDVTTNCAAYQYTYNLVHDDKFDALDSSVWSIRDGAVYFHDMLALAATPEYDVVYERGNITKSFELDPPALEKLVVRYLHNAEEMAEVPTELITLATSNEDVAKIAFDDDDNLFIQYIGAGTTTCSITIGKTTVTFTVTLNQVMHITSVEDFRTKVPQALNGVIVLDADIDFKGETVQGKNEDGSTIWEGYDEFTGSFDGQGHTISNLKLGDGRKGGLFGKLTNGGIIKNVAFVNLVTAGNGGAHGLIGTIDGGACIENCYVDIKFHANGLNLDANWAGTGPFCVLHAGDATIKNCIANIRFAEGFDLAAIDHIGAISGKAAAWAGMCYDVKVIVNANVNIKLAYADAVENDGVQKTWTTCAWYKNYKDFAEGDLATYSEYWTINEKGITFGEKQVLAVPEWTLTDGETVANVFEDGAQSFEVSVGIVNYVTTLTALPEGATVSSSNEEVATAEIVEGKIVVTPVGVGEATITVTIGDASAKVIVKLLAPVSCDIIYDGGNLDVTFETAKTLDVVIKGEKDGAECEIPQSVSLTSTNENVAVLVWNDGVLNVKVLGAGTTTLSAVCGNGQGISFEVTAKKVYQIASVGDFRSKIAADLAGSFVLTADLDFQGNTPTGSWSSFGDFSGVIDGQGHKIENLLLGDSWNGGIFVWYSGTIKNVAFVNVQQAGSMHGLVGGITGGKFENVYVDYVISSNGKYLDVNWCAAGAFATDFGEGSIKDCIVNVRFADSFNLAEIDRVGLVSGKASSYNGTCQNVKIIVNGSVGLKLAYADAVENDDVQKQWNATQYSDFAALLASGVEAYSSELWTIDASGISFGGNKVLQVAAAE